MKYEVHIIEVVKEILQIIWVESFIFTTHDVGPPGDSTVTHTDT